MASNSSPAKSLAVSVESDDHEKFMASLNPRTNPYTTYRGEAPLYGMSTKGIWPGAQTASAAELIAKTASAATTESSAQAAAASVANDTYIEDSSAATQAAFNSSTGQDSILKSTAATGYGVGGHVAQAMENIMSAATSAQAAASQRSSSSSAAESA